MSIFFASFGASVQALPIYSARSARVCDNCHYSPFESNSRKAWKNPELPKRKCNMSCQSCHVLPSGGGIRNAVGRYYAASTLPAFGARHRPYHDQKLAFTRWLRQLDKPARKQQSTDKVMKPAQKKSEEEDLAPAKWFYPKDWLSFGYPLFSRQKLDGSRYSLKQNRFPDINADPLLTIGSDVRPTFYAAQERTFVFPMQVDAGAALHPVEHVTASSTVGLQGRLEGADATASQKKPWKTQNAYLMLHELPYQAYLMAGLFMPEFGVRFEDHTLFTRRPFEMDTSVAGNPNLVRGIQVGAAPNYPYLSASIFQTQDSLSEITGEGYTVNALWRDIPYGGGVSWMQKKRAFEKGGNFSAISVQGYYNLWHLFPSMRYTNPVTITIEYVVGKKPRTVQHDKLFSANILRIDYLVWSGLNMHSSYEFYDDDWEIKKDTLNRVGLGADWTFYRGFRLSWNMRSLFGGSESSTEMILFLHAYL